MGLAIDTVLATAGTIDTAFHAATAVAGDSLVVRQYAQGSRAQLEYIGLQASAAGVLSSKITSPALADNVEGIYTITKEQPAAFLFPSRTGEQVQPGDTLGLSLANSGGVAAGTTAAALGLYYANLDGIAAQLKMWSDISGSIEHIKAFVVTGIAATVNAWVDTSINTAAAQLDADRYYAVLGYQSGDPYAAVGIKGQSTGNLRVCGPGATSTLDISNYFVEMSEKHQTPHIPVFYANNRGSTYLSTAAGVAPTNNSVALICAQLSANFRP